MRLRRYRPSYFNVSCVKRFTVILSTLPGNIPPALLDAIESTTGTSGVPELPAILGEHFEEAAAQNLQTEFQIFGAILELIPEDEDDKPALDPGLSFEDLSQELDRELEELKKETSLPESEPEKPSGSEFSLSFDDTPAQTEEHTPAQDTKKKDDPLASLSLSFEEDKKAISEAQTSAPPSSHSPAIDVTEIPEVASSFTSHEASSPVDLPPAISPFKAAAPGSEQNTIVSSDEYEEYEDDSEIAARPQINPLFLICGGLILLAAGTFLFLSSNDHHQEELANSGDVVQALLEEQRKILRDQRAERLAAMKAADMRPSEYLYSTLESGLFKGSVRLGKVQEGFVLDQLRLEEPQREKLTPTQLAAGKMPRPWIKRIENVPGIQDKTPLAKNFSYDGTAFAYIEDEAGNLRVPLLLRLTCNLEETNSLNCSFILRNKGESLDEKRDFMVQRDESLGFKLALDGEFNSQLAVENRGKHP